jgi:hypothetical protein
VIVSVSVGVVTAIAAMAVAAEFWSVATTDPLVEPVAALKGQVKAPEPVATIVEPEEVPVVHAPLGVWDPERPGMVSDTLPPAVKPVAVATNWNPIGPPAGEIKSEGDVTTKYGAFEATFVPSDAVRLFEPTDEPLGTLNPQSAAPYFPMTTPEHSDVDGLVQETPREPLAAKPYPEATPLAPIGPCAGAMYRAASTVRLAVPPPPTESEASTDTVPAGVEGTLNVQLDEIAPPEVVGQELRKIEVFQTT